MVAEEKEAAGEQVSGFGEVGSLVEDLRQQHRGLNKTPFGVVQARNDHVALGPRLHSLATFEVVRKRRVGFLQRLQFCSAFLAGETFEFFLKPGVDVLR